MAKILIGNIKGEKGDTGNGLTIFDYYDTMDELPTNPSAGDAYGVKNADGDYEIHIYSPNKGWVNNGALQPDIDHQAPTYAEAETLESLTSGEKISIAFGKIKKAIKDLISHLGNKENPHEVTAYQVDALSISGGTLNGSLDFNNPNDYQAIKKVRKIADVNHHLTVGVSSNGSSTFEHYTDGKVDGRLELRTVEGNKNALVLSTSTSGTAYNIYGEHNKPTANDVGAITKQVELNGKDLLSVTDDGFYYCVNATNVPTSTAAGYLRVVVADTKHRKVCWHPSNSITEYVNVLSNGTWLGWHKILTEKV